MTRKNKDELKDNNKSVGGVQLSRRLSAGVQLSRRRLSGVQSIQSSSKQRAQQQQQQQRPSRTLMPPPVASAAATGDQQQQQCSSSAAAVQQLHLNIIKAFYIYQKYVYTKSYLYTLICIYIYTIIDTDNTKKANSLVNNTKKATSLVNNTRRVNSLSKFDSSSLVNNTRRVNSLSKFDYILDEYFNNENDYPYILIPFECSLEDQINKLYIYLKTIGKLFKDTYKTVNPKDFINLSKKEIIPHENELLTTDGGGKKKSLDVAKIRRERIIAAAEKTLKRMNRGEKTLKSKRMNSVFNKYINGCSDLTSNFRLNKTLPLNIIEGIFIQKNKRDLKDELEEDKEEDEENAPDKPDRSKWISNAAQCQGAGLTQECEDKCYLCMIPTPPYTSHIKKCRNWDKPDKLITRECEHILFFNLAYQLDALIGNNVQKTELNKNNYKWSHKLCNGTHKSQACFIDYDSINLRKWFVNETVIKAVIVSILSDPEWQTIIWPNSNSEWCTKKSWPIDVNKISEENSQKLFETIFNNIKNTVEIIVTILNSDTPCSNTQYVVDIPYYTNWDIVVKNGVDSKTFTKVTKVTIKDLKNYVDSNTVVYIAKNNTVVYNIDKNEYPIPESIIYEINTEYNKVIEYENKLSEEKKNIDKRRESAIEDAQSTLNELNKLYTVARKYEILPINLINIVNYVGTNYQEKYDANYNDFIAPTLKDIEAKQQELKMLNTKPRLLFDSNKKLNTLYVNIDDIYNKAITEYNNKIGAINVNLRNIREKFLKDPYYTIINIDQHK